MTTNPWTGLSFHDIRFKGERILFELSLDDQVYLIAVCKARIRDNVMACTKGQTCQATVGGAA